MSIRQAFWVFALLIVLVTMADRILFVILPLWLIGMEFSATEIGLIFSVGGLFLAAFRFLVGRLSDIRGRKSMMSLGLLADSIATAFYPAATALVQFSIVKGIKEIAYNVTSTMEDAMLGDSFPRNIRLRMLSRLGTVFPLGRALAAIIGFLVVTYLSVTYGFYVAALSLFLAFLVIAVFYREAAPSRVTSYRLSFRNITRPLFIVSLIAVANNLSFTIAYFPGFFILADSLGLGEAELFLMFLLTYIIASLFAWKTEGWVKAHGRESILGVTCLGFGFATMLYALASGTAVFYIALLGVAISFYVFRICYKTLLLDSTDKEHRGEQVGFSKMMSSLGGIAGPVTGGLLIDAVSLQAAFLFAGSFGILAFLLAMWLKRM